MGWLLLTYKLPSGRSSARVAVWREVRRAGALQLQQSVVVFPDTDAFRPAIERIRAVLADVGGTGLAVRAEPIAAGDEKQLVAAWNEARAAEYVELTAECEKLVAEIDKEIAREKFTLAELDEEEAELEKLTAWHERITARDVHDCGRAPAAQDALARASEAVSRFSHAVFERTHG